MRLFICINLPEARLEIKYHITLGGLIGNSAYYASLRVVETQKYFFCRYFIPGHIWSIGIFFDEKMVPFILSFVNIGHFKMLENQFTIGYHCGTATLEIGLQKGTTKTKYYINRPIFTDQIDKIHFFKLQNSVPKY